MKMQNAVLKVSFNFNHFAHLFRPCTQGRWRLQASEGLGDEVGRAKDNVNYEILISKSQILIFNFQIHFIYSPHLDIIKDSKSKVQNANGVEQRML